MRKPNQSRKHHYAPRFYLRRFALSEGSPQIAALWRQEPFVLSGTRSIDNIGYEDDLHTIIHPDGELSVEAMINERIETPLSKTETWNKIVSGDAAALNTSDDKLNLFLLARHMQARNLETLRFIEAEQANIASRGFPADYSSEEKEMHATLSRSPSGPKRLFMQMATDVARFIADLPNVSMAIFTSPIRLRTSSNPVLIVPPSIAGGRLARWLPLGRHFGLWISDREGTAELHFDELDESGARMLNRLFIVQLLEGISVRYCFADDEYISDDLAWAGFELTDPTARGARYKRQKPGSGSNWLARAWS